MTRSGHFGHPGRTAVFKPWDRLTSRPVWGVGTRRPEIIRVGTRRPGYRGADDPPVREEELPLASTRTPVAEPLLTPAEVATMFRVDPKTVTRWAKAGKLTSIRTLGGHRRYRETEVRALLGGIPQQRESD